MVWPTPDKRATKSSVGGEKVLQFNYMVIGNRLEYDAKAELEFALTYFSIYGWWSLLPWVWEFNDLTYPSTAQYWQEDLRDKIAKGTSHIAFGATPGKKVDCPLPPSPVTIELGDFARNIRENELGPVPN